MWFFFFFWVFTIGRVCKELYWGTVTKATFIQWVFILIAIWFHYLLMSSLITSSLINEAVFQVSSSLIVNMFWCFHTDILWWKVSFLQLLEATLGKTGMGTICSMFPWDISGLRARVLSNWDWVKCSYFMLSFLQIDELSAKFCAWKLIESNLH